MNKKAAQAISWPDGWYVFTPANQKLRITNGIVEEADGKIRLLKGIKTKRLRREQFRYMGETYE